MKKDKLKAKAKSDRKKAEKAVKAELIVELTQAIGKFAEPNKKIKKLVQKAATALAKEIEKTAKPVPETTNNTVEKETAATPQNVAAPVVRRKKTAPKAV